MTTTNPDPTPTPSLERKQLAGMGRLVVKIGSALLTDNGRGLNRKGICDWVAQMASLRSQGKEVVLVSSGSVAEGIHRLGWGERPAALHKLQAAAAVGQMGLVQTYESCFKTFGLHTAQILLTHDELSRRQRYLNARGTLRTLLDMGVVPVVNENDTVATDEIRFGDNDTLAALVANLVEADLLIILTDQPGLCERDPRTDPDAPLIHQARADAAELDTMATSGSGGLGRGGMLTKIRAARRAARSGSATVIAAGREPEVLTRIAAGQELGTLLLPGRAPLAARKQWLASHMRVSGRLHIDHGAERVLRDAGSSLLPVGVTGLEGRFARGEMVSCINPQGREIARGLVNYSAAEAKRIIGKPSREIEALLGYVDGPELIHRDNLVVL